jgi:nicotinate (nicotinamide) nucleotide adenylyltransferase
MDRRGYHEEMVRAFSEFRKNPEWFLDLYKKGLLENELMLSKGRLSELFPNARLFIFDLEKHWRMFWRAYFKRVQGPPIPIVSKRAFGTDLRESFLSPHFTDQYARLRAEILSREPPRIAVYGGSFNPPALHHRYIVTELLAWFDEIYIVPCGVRDVKASLKDIPPDARKKMVELAFQDIPCVSIDTHDLDNGVFTPAWKVDERYKNAYSGKEIWHIIGGDLIIGGHEGNSEIQRTWKKGKKVWENVHFVVIARPGFASMTEDLPPLCEVIEIEDEYLIGSSTLIRERIARDEDVKPLLNSGVYEYIKNAGLYKGGS